MAPGRFHLSRELPEPALTEPEKERGYLLFQRPSTECVYPNTRPLAEERIDSLVAFATPGEFEPVTFALFPVRPLQNLKVRASPLTSSADEIPAGSIEVRLATYWNVGYPAYTTLNTYRRAPELLDAGDGPLLARGRVPMVLADGPCARRRSARRQSRLQQPAQFSKALRQLPAGKRSGLVQRPALVFEQGKIVQR